MTIARRFAVLAATMLTVIAAACAAAPQPASKPVKAAKPGKLLFGVYEQTSPGSYTQLNQFTQATGVYPAIVSYYSQWWMTFQTGFADEAHANGAEVLVQMQPRQVSCQAVSSGVTDGYLEQYASQVKAFRYPVILSFGQEMNGTWYPWGIAGCPPGAFIATWKHVVRVFRAAGANNVTWLWDPNVNYAGGRPLRDWWPGSSYVDWIGLDGYYAYPADTFGTLFLPSINAIRSFTDKPLLIAESGVTAMDGTGRLKDLYTAASDADAVGVVYFDVKQSGDPEHQDWRLEDSSGMLQTFRSLAQVLTRRQLSPLTVAHARSRSRSSRATREDAVVSQRWCCSCSTFATRRRRLCPRLRDTGFGALWIPARGFFTRMDLGQPDARAGTVFILIAGAFGLYPGAVIGAHDIIPVLPFCAVLAGRLFGERLAALRLEPVLDALAGATRNVATATRSAAQIRARLSRRGEDDDANQAGENGRGR